MDMSIFLHELNWYACCYIECEFQSSPLEFHLSILPSELSGNELFQPAKSSLYSFPEEF